jgi:cytochrome c oxidase subunit 3/cytochrome o ubiquinol oxidase subunit 3
MSALTIPITQSAQPWVLPDRGRVAMAALIIAETAIFTIFVVAYLFYTGKSLSGPTPNEGYQITRLTTSWYDFYRRDRLAARSVPMFLGCR